MLYEVITLIEMDYLKIALMNVIPALIYFTFVMYMVDLEALRSGLRGLPTEEIPAAGVVLRAGWYYFILV